MYILKVMGVIFAIIVGPQRMRLYFLLGFFLFSACIQVVGVASISPFITLLSDPEMVNKSQFFQLLYSHSGSQTVTDFTVLFAWASALMIVLSNGASGLTHWLLVKYSVFVGGELQERLYKNFLMREYLFHKTSNYNQVISTITADAPRFVYMVLQSFLTLVSNLFVAIVIVFGLLAIDPITAITSAFVIGGSYLLTYICVKKMLVYHGKKITYRNDTLLRILSESFIGIKDIKVSRTEKRYLDKFDRVNYEGLNSAAVISLAGDLPRFLIETVSFGAIIVLAIILLTQNNSPGHVFSLLSVYALAGYKLLPTLQQIYKSLSAMSGHGSVVFDILRELNHPVVDRTASPTNILPTVNELRLENVSYSYPGTTVKALNNVTLSFRLGTLNTIAGNSGSGKSTLADILLGLLDVQGKLMANGESATGESLEAYQRTVGYVPQHIFIIDDTVVANVAFGVPEQEIDMDLINKALRDANAMEFVERMPLGVHTPLGQDGKLLSGGQRQRIGIARSLYRQSKVLILDEPTSALDINSEFQLMSLLDTLKKDILIIVISHRPAAIKMSDKICILHHGEVVGDDHYESLLANNNHFKEMMEKGMMHQT